MEVKKLLKQSYPTTDSQISSLTTNEFFLGIWYSGSRRFSHIALEITNFLTLHDTPEIGGSFEGLLDQSMTWKYFFFTHFTGKLWKASAHRKRSSADFQV